MSTLSLIQQLNQQYALDNAKHQINFKAGRGDLPVVEVRNEHASALISLQGAHLLSWIPEGNEEAIWLSEDAKFAKGKSIRGGIPVCWPWFGAHEANPQYPAHGFARTSLWQIAETNALDNGNTQINFTLPFSSETKEMWPFDTKLDLQMTIGKTLQIELTTINNSSTAVKIGQALHTYFNIGSINNVSIHGLENTDYLDKTNNFKCKHQQGEVTISEEVDRIYLNTTADCVIEDNALKRKIIISKQGSHSTVVWNPWKEVSEKMGDLGNDGYKKMICVESCNAADDVVTIAPGQKYTLHVQYEAKNI